MYYSQSQEDKTLYETYFKSYKLSGQKYYLEMGAMNGVTYSNTKFYEDTLGWKGILVEPNPLEFNKLINNRPKNYLLSVICSDQKSPLEFSICVNIPAVSSVKLSEPSGFNNMYYNYSNMIRTNLIPMSLDSIIEKSGLERIDLCIIDVEGHEISVLNSFSFKIPIVSWLIEFLDEEKDKVVQAFMERNNYKFMGKCAHNGFFIHNDYLKYFDLEVKHDS